VLCTGTLRPQPQTPNPKPLTSEPQIPNFGRKPANYVIKPLRNDDSENPHRKLAFSFISDRNRLDYYSGNFAMGFMLYTGLVRAGWTRLSLSSSMARLGLLGAISAGLGAHMASGWGKIDYGLNMKVWLCDF